MRKRYFPTRARNGHPQRIIGPTGLPLTRETLPSPDTKRWGMRRKAEVVTGVNAGLITLEEACLRYALSEDEFQSWRQLLRDHGLAGLRATQAKKYRSLKLPVTPGNDS